MPVDEIGERKPSRQRQQSSSSFSSSSSSSSDSVFSEDASYTSMPSPPDGGYGWMIVFSAFLINLISDGISFSFGILYTELLDYFEESKSLTSWVGSVFYGTCLMGGPLASALATKFGCRNVLIGGGIVATFGTFMSAFATDIRVLMVSFGIVTGLGMSMGYVTSLVMVAFYFEDKRALATGLSVCGSGIGTFVFAPLTEYLIEIYGWRGTMIIWSGIILNLVVCGALLRPLEFSAQERRQRALQKFERMSRTVSFTSFSHASKNLSRHGSHTDGLEDEIDPFEEGALDYCHSQIQIPTFLKEKNIPIEVLKEAKKNRSILKDYIDNYRDAEEQEVEVQHIDETKQETTVMLTNGKTDVKLANGHNSTEEKPKGSCLKNSSKVNQLKGKNQGNPKKHVRMSTYLPLYRKGLFFRGNLARVAGQIGEVRSSSCPELSRKRWESDSSDSSDDDEWDFIWRYLHFSKHMKRVIKTLFDPSILLHPLYVVFAISNFILYFWYDVPYIFMADRAIEQGLDESKASFLISVLGIVNTVGQIIYGFIGDRDVNLSLLYGFSLMACGLSIVLVPLFTAFTPLAVISGVFGLFISVNYSLSTVILVEYLGLDKLSNAYGLTMLVQGVANLVGPPIAASLYDVTHSYDLTFFFGGGFIILSGAMLLGVPILRKCQARLRYEKRVKSCTLFNATYRTSTDEEEDHVTIATESNKMANTRDTPRSTLLVAEKNGTAFV